MTSITVRAVEAVGVGKKEAERAKNMFALGLVSWMYGRPTEPTLEWLERKFGSKQEIFDANVAAFKAGYNFGETTELFAHPVPGQGGAGRARHLPQRRRRAGARVGPDRRVATAAACRCSTRATRSRPASDLLHELSRHKNFGVITVQAEDEIAAANMALGAAFTGQLAVTGTSGPGIDLKAETLGLAVITELPMIVVDVQRAGPSTGMPTKTEQADLLAAMFGRHGESPIPIVAASSPSDCFEVALEAARVAVRYRTPVIVLSDTFLQNSSEPWRLPDVGAIRADRPGVRARRTATAFQPYARDDHARASLGDPGHAGSACTGSAVSSARTSPAHQLRRREPRAHDAPPARQGARASLDAAAAGGRRSDGDAELLVLGWGSSLGHDPRGGRPRARRRGEGRHGAPPMAQPVADEHRRGASRGTRRC